MQTNPVSGKACSPTKGGLICLYMQPLLAPQTSEFVICISIYIRAPHRHSAFRYIVLFGICMDRVNVTCSRPQQTVPWPGLEPGTPWSVVRDANQCASPPHFFLSRYTASRPRGHSRQAVSPITPGHPRMPYYT